MSKINQPTADHGDQKAILGDATARSRLPDLLLKVLPLLVLLALAFVPPLLAYQRSVTGTVTIGGPLSELFLETSAALDESAVQRGLFYGDELDADGGRSRWTRQRASVHVAGLGERPGPLSLRVLASGWPPDVLNEPVAQPSVRVLANGHELGTIFPEPGWRDYNLTIPAGVTGSTLELSFECSDTFLKTDGFQNDLRPKGLRLRALSIAAHSAPEAPDWTVVLGCAAVVVLAYLTLRRLRLSRSMALLAAALPALGLAALVAFGRILAAPLLPWLLGLLLAMLLLTLLPPLRSLHQLLSRRMVASGALQTAMLVAAVVTLLGVALPLLIASPPVDPEALRTHEPEALIQGLLIVSLLLISLINMGSMSRVVRWVRFRMLFGRWAHVVFVVLLVGWLAYEWSVVSELPFVGHADYADNAVVARNLVRGRGWVVDYVTQYYQLYQEGSVVRPQETWPLLQPVWMAPFMALFGPQAWAAKIPNLIFTLLLALGLFTLAARLWDRRVGLVAAILTLSNQFFFFLTIYTTSDLGLVLFSFGAIALFFLAHEHRKPRLLLFSGLLTGLMALQKPGAGVLLGVGMAIWWLFMHRHGYGLGWRTALLRWVLPAALIFSPYLIRNLVTFGSPLHSTESRDAWVLGYGSDEEIYKLYVPVPELSTLGPPDRSWLLRWGYGRTVQKVASQLRATRNYLLPPLPALGGLSGQAQLLGVVTTWLAIAGLASSWGRSRGTSRLFGLVAVAFLPYLLFLWTYWHANEERYFLPLVPWLALCAGVGLIGIFDMLVEAWSGRLAIVGAAFAALLLALAMQQGRSGTPSGWQQINQKLEREPASWALDLQAFEWLRQNTAPDSVVMTRVPWQLTFHADRPSLMTPNTDDLPKILRVARYYGADYLLVNAQTMEKEGARIALAMLINGTNDWGLERVHAVNDESRTIYIYRFPSDYGGVSEIKAP